jgi:seryl-tRNA synthetase
MLQIQKIRDDKETVLAGLEKKFFAELGLLDKLLELDEKKRATQVALEEMQARVNKSSKEIGLLMKEGKREEAEAKKIEVKNLKEEGLEELSSSFNKLEEEIKQILLQLPNLPHESVPKGKTEEDNEIVKTQEPPTLKDDALPHWELAKKYDLIDFELGVKITGAGFPVYKNQGAKYQRALIQYFLDFNAEAGFSEVMPPLLVNEDSAYGTGNLPDKEGQMYHATADNFYLIPTAEIPITNIYRGDIIDPTDLPIKMTGYTPCFRREAGSYGKDVRGLNRLHQFDKVEVVQLVKAEDSYNVLDKMVAHVEKLIQSLDLPYRILRLCSGDTSFASALTFDFEVYSAAQKRWLEVSSVSNFESFQTNRMKIRTRNESGKTELVHSLNGSALALPRILACLLENNQTENSIAIPTVLQPYFGKEEIS